MTYGSVCEDAEIVQTFSKQNNNALFSCDALGGQYRDVGFILTCTKREAECFKTKILQSTNYNGPDTSCGVVSHHLRDQSAVLTVHRFLVEVIDAFVHIDLELILLVGTGEHSDLVITVDEISQLLQLCRDDHVFGQSLRKSAEHDVRKGVIRGEEFGSSR